MKSLRRNNSYSSLGIILLFLLLLNFCPIAVSSENAVFENDELSKNIESGIEYLFNLDDEKAEECFTNAVNIQPKSPEGYFYLAMVHWNKIYFKNDKSALPSLEKWIDKTIEVAEESVENSNDKEKKASSYLYLGGAYGYKGVISAIRHQWFSGFINAYRGRKYLNKSYSLNPHNKDLYLGMGMYDYSLDKLPKTIKILTYLMAFSGDREEGIAKLKDCAENGHYAKTEALIALANIYLYLEKDYNSAFPVIRKLKEKYPGNPQFHYLYAITCARLEKWEDAEKTADMMEKMAEEENSHFAGIWEIKREFLKGEIHWIKQDFKNALKFYEEVLLTKRVKSNWVFPMAEMRIGLINDFLDRREEAVKKYKAVLAYEKETKDYAYLYDYARKYLKNPCRIDDAERMD